MYFQLPASHEMFDRGFDCPKFGAWAKGAAHGAKQLGDGDPSWSLHPDECQDCHLEGEVVMCLICLPGLDHVTAQSQTESPLDREQFAA